MEQRVSIITLGVANLERSREFYERIGWRRSMAQSEGIVFFQAGGMAVALCCSRGLGIPGRSARIQCAHSF